MSIARSYGVRDQIRAETPLERVAEDVRTLGYAVLESGLPASALAHLREQFDAAHHRYVARYGADYLRSIDEFNTIRQPMLESSAFVDLAFLPVLHELLGQLIEGSYLLNQQNAIINPAREEYNQGAWHRDLPYQHFVSTTPLAINALFCVDDFTLDNGATYVLPATHKQSEFPSQHFIDRHALQVAAPAGSFIVLDCMTFHRGGWNGSSANRRAVNHVFTIPFFRSQIEMPEEVAGIPWNEEQRKLLGLVYRTPDSVADYLATRARKFGKQPA
ncbi:phytanoyl-CoA dioxygenase family protein [Herbaspirillum rubrisubalbicans]|uniref:phytanoyl-CoA dioxygenase family protein n=1 Tax=Herbaspirillum rubrisubalbicans TaxID=80842 RepID=UPI001D55E632|nr:phytanoyl-CoA dioxygenase family protein [Herbaspirillum rubrisubalbicans]NQE51271.1 hypothetical protein [Herbaspirillum rubrisubalbicans]